MISVGKKTSRRHLMASPITSEEKHCFNPKREFFFLIHTLNFCPQRLHTQKCSVCVSPARCIPTAAPTVVPAAMLVVADNCAHPSPVNNVVGTVTNNDSGEQHIADARLLNTATGAPRRAPAPLMPQQPDVVADEPKNIFFPLKPFACTSATTCKS